MGHEPHRPIDVPEELLIAGTEIIETRFTVWRFDKTVLGAFAVADESDLTLAAVFGQGIELILAELSLLSGAGQLGHVLFI